MADPCWKGMEPWNVCNICGTSQPPAKLTFDFKDGLFTCADPKWCEKILAWRASLKKKEARRRR